MKNKKLYITTAIISLIFLILISATAIAFSISLKRNDDQEPSAPPNEVFIYVTETDTDTAEEEEFTRIVREYEGQIGIFDGENRLQRVLDTYVKTLPSADREQLREGITVKSEKELYSIIEAYSN